MEETLRLVGDDHREVLREKLRARGAAAGLQDVERVIVDAMLEERYDEAASALYDRVERGRLIELRHIAAMLRV